MLVATEVVLWPHRLGEPATVEEASLWPVVVVTGRCRWSVLDARNALPAFTVHASTPGALLREIIILRATRAAGHRR